MACLTEDVILRLVEGDLPPEQLAEVEEHFVACDECRGLAADVARSVSASGLVAADAVSDLEQTIATPVDSGIGHLPSIGEHVARYVVTQRIGSGGMGVVFLAWDPTLDRSIVLKVLHPDRQRHEAYNAMLLREAQAMARLSHPNVVAVHDAGIFDERVFLAMQFVEGSTLRDWTKKERRPWQQTVDVFAQAGRGLASAHAAGIVHRDFKPANVLVGNDGRARVTDFGLALNVGTAAFGIDSAVRLGESSVISEKTQTGTIKGTPAYMAPEQYEGKRADARSDQFSFCVALYEALYGVRPFTGSDVDELKSAVLMGTPNLPLPSHDVPSSIHAVVTRGLNVEPDARFASMDELLNALEAKPDVSHETRTSKPEAIALPKSRRKILLGGSAVVALLLLLAVGIGRMGTRTNGGRSLAEQVPVAQNEAPKQEPAKPELAKVALESEGAGELGAVAPDSSSNEGPASNRKGPPIAASKRIRRAPSVSRNTSPAKPAPTYDDGVMRPKF